MGKIQEISFETKAAIVLAYERSEGSIETLAKRFDSHPSSITKWIMMYEAQGIEALKRRKVNKRWAKEVKLSAVTEYLSGKGSLHDVCKKYKISDTKILRQWIKVYNSHKEFKTTGSGGKRTMTKGRKLTFDEKVEIVQYCIAHGRDYYDTMEKYQVSYQQIYSWVRKYDKDGIDALVDRRGKAKPEDRLTDMDRLRMENKMLETRNIELEMEVRLLKKLQEIERRRR